MVFGPLRWAATSTEVEKPSLWVMTRTSTPPPTTKTVGDDRIGGLRVNDNAVVFVKDGEGDVTVLTRRRCQGPWSEAALGVGWLPHANNTSGYAYVVSWLPLLLKVERTRFRVQRHL